MLIILRRTHRIGSSRLVCGSRADARMTGYEKIEGRVFSSALGRFPRFTVQRCHGGTRKSRPSVQPIPGEQFLAAISSPNLPPLVTAFAVHESCMPPRKTTLSPSRIVNDPSLFGVIDDRDPSVWVTATRRATSYPSIMNTFTPYGELVTLSTQHMWAADAPVNQHIIIIRIIVFRTGNIFPSWKVVNCHCQPCSTNIHEAF